MKPAVLFLGFDAADFMLIEHWANEGFLPTFLEISKRSASRVISNAAGLYVGAIWPTISTGTTPDYHGRYCWRQYRPGTYFDEFIQVNQIKGEPIWDALDRAGKSVCVLDIPKSLPHDRFTGVFIKDWGTHDQSTGGFRVLNWLSKVEVISRYGYDKVGHCDSVSRTQDGISQFIEHLKERSRSRVRMLLDLLDERRHDFLMCAFSEAHCVGHQCWHLHDEDHNEYNKYLRESLGDPVLQVYRELDSCLALILDTLRTGDSIFIVATHGMGSSYSAVELLNPIAAIFSARELGNYNTISQQLKQVPPYISLDTAEFRQKLLAFPIPNNGAYAAFRLNLVGREPNGLIPASLMSTMVLKLRDFLLSLKDDITKQPLFLSANFPSQNMSGPMATCLPDLTLEWNRATPITRVCVGAFELVNHTGGNPRTGDHKSEGKLWHYKVGKKFMELPECDMLLASEIRSIVEQTVFSG